MTKPMAKRLKARGRIGAKRFEWRITRSITIAVRLKE